MARVNEGNFSPFREFTRELWLASIPQERLAEAGGFEFARVTASM